MFSEWKYRLPKALLSLLLIAGFGTFMEVTAHHILGGEVTYSHISGKKYTFQVKMYRNCNECEFNSGNCSDIRQLEVYASPDVLNYALKLSAIPLTRISRKDITPVCKTVMSSCSGGTFPEGIEEWLFEGAIDFDTINPDYCLFEIGLRVEAREDVYNLNNNDAFYNFARLNICGGRTNNSPAFRAAPYYLLSENQSFTYNLLAKDQDGDSLSYKLVSANKAWNSSVTYGTGYNSQKPLDVYCPQNCNLDRSKWPIEGIGIDEVTGWFGFTPMTLNQKAFLAVEVTEWRKSGSSYVKVGVTRRDIQVTVIASSNHYPKISTSGLSFNACADQSLMIDFTVLDQLYNGIRDSVSFQVYSDLPGISSEKVKGSAKNQYDAFINIPIKREQIRKHPYYLTIVARDDHCPLSASTYHTIEIYVHGIPGKTGVIQYTKCNEIAFSSSLSGSEYTQTWFLSDSAGLIDNKTGTNGSFDVPAPGKYYLVHQVSNSLTGCITESIDSVVVPYFSLMTPAMNWPANVCSGELFTLKAGFNGGTAPFQYWWNGIYGPDSLRVQIDGDSTLKLKITDDKGCELNFSGKIAPFPRLNLTVTDTSMCLPSSARRVVLNNRFHADSWIPDNLQLTYSGGNGWFGQIGKEWQFEPSRSGDNIFSYVYTDSFGCRYNGEFLVRVINPVPTGIVAPAAVCSNDAPVNLNEASGCDFTDGSWACDPNPGSIDGAFFDPSESGAGTFTLYFVKDLDGCLIHDTTAISVNPAPVVGITGADSRILCETTPGFHLEATPAGGQWSNNAGLPSTPEVVPALIANTGEAEYYYSYTDPLYQCTSSDTVTLIVNKKVVLSIVQPLSVCEGDRLELSPEPVNFRSLTLDGDVGYFDIQRVDQRYILTANNVNRRETAQLMWIATALPGCEDQQVKFFISVKPRPEITLSGLPEKGCSPMEATLKVENLNQDVVPDVYQWREGIDWVSGGSSKAVTLITAGDYPFTSRASLEGCMGDPAFASLKVLPTPIVNFSVDPASATLTADFSHATFTSKTACTVPFGLLWEFEKGTPAFSTKSRVDVDFPSDTGLYKVKLTATTDSGCMAVGSRSIRVRPGLQFYVPNSFTPDGKGPGENEMFRIVMDSTSMFKLRIRNRWGEVVFESQNASASWNGRYMGKDAPAGIYIWEVEATTVYGIYIRRAGPVSLIR